MKSIKITNEFLLYSLIFILAIFLRSLSLADNPLTDSEAELALQALQVSSLSPGSVEIGVQPGYTLISGGIFGVLGSGNFVARLLSVAAGSFLVWVPFLFRKHLGQTAALIMAIGLAVDPGLVAVSRLAGSPIVALSFGLLTAGALVSGSYLLSGVLAGFSLLFGPAIITGVLGLLLALVAVRFLLLQKNLFTKILENSVGIPKLAAGMTGVLLLGSTFFLRFPQGIGALVGLVPVYMKGWMVPSGTEIWVPLLIFVMFTPLAFIFGTAAVVRAWIQKQVVGQYLSLWFLAAILLVVANPGRQVWDLTWGLIPLWGLAGLELSRFEKRSLGMPWIPMALAGIVFAMLMNGWINLAGVTQVGAGDQAYWLRWLVILGAVLLAVLSSILVGLAWSVTAAWYGGIGGLLLGLLVYLISLGWGSAPVHNSGQFNVWAPNGGIPEADLLNNTIRELSMWEVGNGDEIEILFRVDTPALRWTARNWPNATFRENNKTGDIPAIVITPAEETDLGLASAYRGQDFLWRVSPDWESLGFPQWLDWLVNRELPVQETKIILWAKTNLFMQSFTSELSLDGIPEVDFDETQDTLNNNSGILPTE